MSVTEKFYLQKALDSKNMYVNTYKQAVGD